MQKTTQLTKLHSIVESKNKLKQNSRNFTVSYQVNLTINKPHVSEGVYANELRSLSKTGKGPTFLTEIGVLEKNRFSRYIIGTHFSRKKKGEIVPLFPNEASPRPVGERGIYGD